MKSQRQTTRRPLGLGALALVVVALGAFALTSAVGDEAKHNFVGADKCKMCHKKEDAGAQYTIWAESKHANAFAALATDEAKAVAKKMGIEDPQKSGKCLQCHATAYNHGEALAANIEADKDGAPLLTAEEGVSCESCHGAGADYKKKKIMEDRDASIAAGMNAEPKNECVKCHNDKNPTWDPEKYTLADGSKTGFDFDQAFDKIKHPVPEK
ncbi:MAG TPA: cytochrome c family protein [candidate division Zixibacteria bacterium]|nr:cytochrome c family protein [candidate division Zixibacteria bacterium]